MSLKVDKVQLEIIMKSDSTRAEIIKLEDQAKLLDKEFKALKKSGNDALAMEKKTELDAVKTKIDSLRNSIDLSAKTMKELQQRSKELQLQLRNLTPGSEKYIQFDSELKQVNNRMKELRGTAQNTQSGLSNLANGFNKYFAMGAAFIAGITGTSMAFRKLAEDVAHMDDVYSDVMKTTGRTREEVLALNEDFKKMDTRTSRESLNLLARDAGKLGIEGSKNILDFVDAGNQINVALGEDLGDDAIKNIGKMVGVFERSTKQLQGIGLKEQMLAVGSAVNELGASSTASEPYLVAFAGRLGGISKQAKISMADILGYASSLDQDMQQVEMSATALQNFIMKLMGDPAKFAKLAGLEVKAFSNLLNTDANAAIKQVLKALNEKGGFQALIPIFQEMGLDGARATGVLSSLAGSIDKVDEAQRIANKSMTEGTSITKEYDIKNNNLAARLDKAKKAFQETSLELGESLNPILLKSVKGTTYLIKALVELPKWLKENKLQIILLAAVWGVYAVAVYGAAAADKIKVFWTNKVVTSLKSLALAIKANPWGLIATGAILAIAWLNNYLNKQKEVNSEQNKFNDLIQKSKELMEDTKSIEERSKLIERMSKSQLESFQSDLESQINSLEKFDILVKSKAKKEIDNDAELIKLKTKYTQAKTDIERKSLLVAIKWREDALLTQLANEYTANNASLRNLKSYLQKVQDILKTKDNIDPTELSDKEKLKAYRTALKLREDEYRKSQAAIKKLRTDGDITENAMNMALLGDTLKFYQDKEGIEKKYAQNTGDTEKAIADTKLKIRDTYDKQLLKGIDLSYQSIQKSTDVWEKLERQKLLDNYTTKEKFDMESLALDVTTAEKRLDDARKYGDLIADEYFANEEDRTAAVNKATEEITIAETKLSNAQEKLANKKYATEEAYQKKRQELIDKYGLGIDQSMSARYRKELTELKDALDEKFLTEKEYEQAVSKLKSERNVEYAQEAVGYAAKITDAVNAYHQAETDSLENEKQKQLTIAGNDADKRAVVERDFAQKELDLKKKQANATMAIGIAQVLANGAEGIAEIWSKHASNPILAGVLTAAEGLIIGAQLVSLKKQRDAIMNTTLDSSASSLNTGTSTGARVVTQAADGRYDVIGAQDGKLYRNLRYAGAARTGLVTTPTIYGEAGTELVISAPDLRRLNMKAPGFNNFVYRNTIGQRADGNYAPLNNGAAAPAPDNTALIAANMAVMQKNAELIQYLIDNGLEAFIMLDQFEKKVTLRNKSLKKGSLKG